MSSASWNYDVSHETLLFSTGVELFYSELRRRQSLAHQQQAEEWHTLQSASFSFKPIGEAASFKLKCEREGY
jgi:hypothetical protein